MGLMNSVVVGVEGEEGMGGVVGDDGSAGVLLSWDVITVLMLFEEVLSSRVTPPSAAPLV